MADEEREVILRLLPCFFLSTHRRAVGASGSRSFFLFIFSLAEVPLFSGTTSAWRGQMMLHLAARRYNY